MKKLLAVILAMSMALSFAACQKNDEQTPAVDEGNNDVVENVVSIWDDAIYTEDTELGEGEQTITLTVTAEDKSVVFTVHGDGATLGDMLMDAGVVEGSYGEWGLFIEKVNGMELVYTDENPVYWALYQGEEYSETGADGIVLAETDARDFALVEEVSQW